MHTVQFLFLFKWWLEETYRKHAFRKERGIRSEMAELINKKRLPAFEDVWKEAIVMLKDKNIGGQVRYDRVMHTFTVRDPEEESRNFYNNVLVCYGQLHGGFKSYHSPESFCAVIPPDGLVMEELILRYMISLDWKDFDNVPSYMSFLFQTFLTVWSGIDADAASDYKELYAHADKLSTVSLTNFTGTINIIRANVPYQQPLIIAGARTALAKRKQVAAETIDSEIVNI